MNNIRILSIVTGITFLCAAFNSWEEQLPNMIFYSGTVLAALGTSIFAIALLRFLRNTTLFTRGIFTALAYIVCLTAAAAYVYYATNGKADSLDSAAHMHVIAFPVLHAFLSLALLVATTIIALTATLIKKTKSVQTD